MGSWPCRCRMCIMHLSSHSKQLAAEATGWTAFSSWRPSPTTCLAIDGQQQRGQVHPITLEYTLTSFTRSIRPDFVLFASTGGYTGTAAVVCTAAQQAYIRMAMGHFTCFTEHVLGSAKVDQSDQTVVAKPAQRSKQWSGSN